MIEILLIYCRILKKNCFQLLGGCTGYFICLNIYLTIPKTNWFIRWGIICDRRSLLLASLNILLSIRLITTNSALYPNINPKQKINLLFTIFSLTLLFFFCERIFFFYFFFELLLIPIILLILGWGYQPERLKASRFLFLYAFFSSFPLLLGLLFIYNKTGTYRFLYLSKIRFYISERKTLSCALYFSILVKLPIYGFHFWLPKAHVEAPTKGRVILAGTFLKLGGYGLYRIIIINRGFNLRTFITIWCLLTGLVTRFICLTLNDCKKLIAYSSIRHIAAILLLLFIYINYRDSGVFIIFFAHGFSSRGLFWLRGIIAALLKTRNLFLLNDIKNSNKIFIYLLFLIVGGNFALPPFINLIRELLNRWRLLYLDRLLLYIYILTSIIVCIYRTYLFYKIIYRSTGKTIKTSKQLSLLERIICVIILTPLLIIFLIINLLRV